MVIELGDIRDYDSVYNAMKGYDVVFHLAALIGIPYSYLSPLAYLRTNVEGTYNVLEAARRQNIEQVIIASTSKHLVHDKKISEPVMETANGPVIVLSNNKKTTPKKVGIDPIQQDYSWYMVRNGDSLGLYLEDLKYLPQIFVN